MSPGRQCPAASPTQGSAVLPTPGSPSPGSRFPPGSRFSARLPFAPQLPVPAAVVPVPSSPRLSLGLRFHPRAELPVPFVPRSSVPSSAPLSSPIPACLSFPRHQHPRFPFRPELLFASRFPFPAGSSSLPAPTFHPVPGAAPFPRFPSPFPFPVPVPFPRSHSRSRFPTHGAHRAASGTARGRQGALCVREGALPSLIACSGCGGHAVSPACPQRVPSLGMDTQALSLAGMDTPKYPQGVFCSYISTCSARGESHAQHGAGSLGITSASWAEELILP